MNEAWRLYVAGGNPSAQHDLKTTWSEFWRKIPPRDGQNSLVVAQSLLHEICRRTATYIPNLGPDVTQIKVWGAEEDARRAVVEIETFEHSLVQNARSAKGVVWTKNNAYDGRVEDREIRRQQLELQTATRLETYKHANFDFQLYLLWPSHVDMKRFRKKHEDSTLREIQINMTCSFDFYEGGIQYVKITAPEEQDLNRVYLRVMNLIRETVAENMVSAHINRLRLPSASQYRDKVGLDVNPETKVAMPTLHGDEGGLPDAEKDKWQSLCRQFDLDNRLTLRREVESIIQTIQAPGQQVRMRITFAELGFMRFELPPVGQDHHTFDDFCKMLREPHTVLTSSMGLPQPNSVDFGDLVPILSAMPEFINFETRSTLHFDFKGSQKSTLRLERELYVGLQGDVEWGANRWLNFPSATKDTEVLEYNMLDFENVPANYQVRIGRANIADLTAQDKSHKTFSHNVSYTQDPLGLQAPARRRAVFPPGNGALKGHWEITFARFNFKSPDSRFELVRKDYYPAEGAYTSTLPFSTLWMAQFYYPEWDTLLAEFGNLKPGEEVSWKRDMDTFFIPANATDDLRPLPKGFGGFMREVEEVQVLLNRAIGSLIEGRGRES